MSAAILHPAAFIGGVINTAGMSVWQKYEIRREPTFPPPFIDKEPTNMAAPARGAKIEGANYFFCIEPIKYR